MGERSEQGAEGAAPSDIEAAVSQIVREVMGRPVGPDDDMFDEGATSLAFVRVLAQINDRFGAMVHVADLDGVATANSIAACVAAPSPSPSPQSIGA